MDALIELITAIRSIRSEYNVQPGKEIDVMLTNPSAALSTALESEERAIKRMSRVGMLTRSRGDAPAHAGAHVVLRGGTDLFIPLAGLVDVEKERERLKGELERIESLLRSTELKLANEQFVSRAPEQVVANERAKVESLRDQHMRLQEKLK